MAEVLHWVIKFITVHYQVVVFSFQFNELGCVKELIERSTVPVLCELTQEKVCMNPPQFTRQSCVDTK